MIKKKPQKGRNTNLLKTITENKTVANFLVMEKA